MVFSVLLFAGCSPSTKPAVSHESEAAKTPAAGPPQPVTAKAAFWPMYTSARNWSPDVVALKLTAEDVTGFKNEAGKAAMWQATFGSPSLHQARVYSYSIASVPPDVFKGVVAGLGMSWGGETRDAMPIDLSSFNTDSDAAYQAAAAEAGPWLKKNPTKELSSFALGSTYRFDAPMWYLMWGDKTSGYVALVDASSGKVLKKK
jgi:hypothetical protein